MIENTIYDATVAFALVASTGAAILSVLTWQLFRRSTLGAVVLLLSIIMSLSIIYHVILIVSGAGPVMTTLFRSTTYTAIALFVWLLVRTQRRIRQPQSGVD